MAKYWLVLVACLLVSCDSPPPPIQTVSGPSIVIKKGGTRYLAVTYWASWCDSCVKEVSSLNALSKTQEKKLQVLGINFDEKTGAALAKDIHSMGIKYPVATQNVALRWHLPVPTVLPTTYLLSPTQHVLRIFYGEDTARQLKNWLASKTVSAHES